MVKRIRRGRPAAIPAALGGDAMLMGILGFLFGGLFCTLAVMSLVKKIVPTMRAMRLGQRAEGVVTANRTQQTQLPAGKIIRPIVAFTDADGTRVEYTDLLVPAGFRQPGQQVTVYYDPEDPKNTATLASWDDAKRQIWVSGLLIVLFGFVCVFGLLQAVGVAP
jgi:Protein of unknown function (DUF3592)